MSLGALDSVRHMTGAPMLGISISILREGSYDQNRKDAPGEAQSKCKVAAGRAENHLTTHHQKLPLTHLLLSSLPFNLVLGYVPIKNGVYVD